MDRKRPATAFTHAAAVLRAGGCYVSDRPAFVPPDTICAGAADGNIPDSGCRGFTTAVFCAEPLSSQAQHGHPVFCPRPVSLYPGRAEPGCGRGMVLLMVVWRGSLPYQFLSRGLWRTGGESPAPSPRSH